MAKQYERVCVDNGNFEEMLAALKNIFDGRQVSMVSDDDSATGTGQVIQDVDPRNGLRYVYVIVHDMATKRSYGRRFYSGVDQYFFLSDCQLATPRSVGCPGYQFFTRLD